MNAPQFDEGKLHEIRVNALLQAFVAQRDTALSNVATLSGDKVVLESRNQSLLVFINNLQTELDTAVKSAMHSTTALAEKSNEYQQLLAEHEKLKQDYEDLQEKYTQP